MDKYYKNEKCFPYEAFIQEAIEKYFNDLGYVIITKEQIDLIADKEDEHWVIEAKGLTSAIGTDFNTCLGQLVKSMSTGENTYAIAIPKLEKYRYQCKLLPDYFRRQVKLHIILVDDEGQVTIILPTEETDEKFGFNN